MLDLKWVRENPEEVAQMLKNRNNSFPLDELLKLDEKRKAALLEVEKLKEKRNAGAKQVGVLKKNGENADALMEEMRQLGDRIGELDAKTAEIQAELDNMALSIPNKVHSSVPVGKDENDNVEIRRWGTPREFSFTPKAHWEIGETLGIMDFERGVKLAESRFTILKKEGARLERALMNFMLDLHTIDQDYTEILPPFMVNRAAMTGTGQLPKFEEDMFYDY